MPHCNTIQREKAMQNRRWQEEAFEQYRRDGALDWLCEATPGSGKTRFGLQVARWWLETRSVDRIVVVCPTAHLRLQWAQAAHGCGLALDPAPVGGLEGPDFRGAILTYQQVAMDPDQCGALCRTRPTGVIFDEIHHAGDSYSWGLGLQRAFAAATRRLALSGTPFRSDGLRIPFVRYGASGLSEPDFRYSYADLFRPMPESCLGVEGPVRLARSRFKRNYRSRNDKTVCAPPCFQRSGSQRCFERRISSLLPVAAPTQRPADWSSHRPKSTPD